MPPVVISVDTSGDTISATSYVTSVNPSRDTNEQYIGVTQEERRTTIEQVKALENIFVSREIRVDKADHLRGLYIIKLKRGICMLETNENNFSKENKAHIDLKTETEGYDIREEIEDNAIRMISVQRKALEVHAAKFKEKLNYELKEANDAKPPQK